MTRLLSTTVVALRERYIAQEWTTKDFPEQVAQTVLDAVPEGWKKNYDGEWLHNFEAPMGKRAHTKLSEWFQWERDFPFHPQRRWNVRAHEAVEGFTEFTPARLLIHNRFLRVRIGGRQLFREWFGMQVNVGPGRWPSLRFNIHSLEVSLTPIKKKEWRRN